MHQASQSRTRRGFTLVESLLAATLLAATVAAISMPFTAAARNQQVDARRTVATSLANDLVEEIISRPFDDPDGSSSPGPETGESGRSAFDNIDDYDGYSEAAGEIVDDQGLSISDPAAFDLARRASVTYVYVTGQDTGEWPNFVRIDVVILRKGLPLVTATRLVYGM